MKRHWGQRNESAGGGGLGETWIMYEGKLEGATVRLIPATLPLALPTAFFKKYKEKE